jgi:hypothetical protein
MATYRGYYLTNRHQTTDIKIHEILTSLHQILVNVMYGITAQTEEQNEQKSAAFSGRNQAAD